MEIELYTSRRVSSGPRKGTFKFLFYKLADGRNADEGAGRGGGRGKKPVQTTRLLGQGCPEEEPRPDDFAYIFVFLSSIII